MYGTIFENSDFISNSEWGEDTLVPPVINRSTAKARLKYFAKLGQWQQFNSLVADLYLAQVEIENEDLYSEDQEAFLDLMDKAMFYHKRILWHPAIAPDKVVQGEDSLMKKLKDLEHTSIARQLINEALKKELSKKKKESAKYFHLTATQWAFVGGGLFLSPVVFMVIRKILSKKS